MSTEIGLPSRNAKPSSMDPKTSHFPPHPPYFYAHLPSGGEVGITTQFPINATFHNPQHCLAWGPGAGPVHG